MSKAKDLTGKTYGELTVVEMLHNYNETKRTYCKCIGIDNNIYIVRQDALQSGATKYIKGACSAGKFEDIAGKRFGRLVAISPTTKRANNSSIIWTCKCDCGATAEVSAGNLKRHHTTSCGCAKRSNSEDYIVRYLNSQNISYETEKTFKDLRNPEGTTNLYFDFYFPKLNLVIEYDGELHYRSFDHFGGEEKLYQIQACDRIKDDYCKKHGIRIIRIPYTKAKKEVIQIIEEVIHP